jgi:hypothetical protein
MISSFLFLLQLGAELFSILCDILVDDLLTACLSAGNIIKILSCGRANLYPLCCEDSFMVLQVAIVLSYYLLMAINGLPFP